MPLPASLFPLHLSVYINLKLAQHTFKVALFALLLMMCKEAMAYAIHFPQAQYQSLTTIIINGKT